MSAHIPRTASPRSVTVLGSTGSVGTQTIDLLAGAPDRFQVRALVAGRNVKLLAEQHAITIDALRDEAARLERRLKRMTWLASIGFALAVVALSFALQASRH